MNYELNKKEVNEYAIWVSVTRSLIEEEEKPSKAFRLATMVVIYGVIESRYDEDRAINALVDEGIVLEDAEFNIQKVYMTLSNRNMITKNNNLTVDGYLKALEGKTVHQVHQAPVTWRSAKMGDLEMLNNMSEQHINALADRNMPAVYRAMNGMQREAFRFNNAITEIPDWNKKLKVHEWAYLNNAKWHLKGKLYFAQTFDFRSRMYYRGAFNPSNSGNLGKAMFKFANKKKLGKEGMKALELHVANQAGVKGSITKRIKWTQKNAVDLFTQVQGKTIKEIKSITGESKIFELYVALHEYNRVQQFGTEAWSDLIIKQDGSCNGIQHAAAILRNKDVAKAVNLCASRENWKPQDIYQDYADALKLALPSKWHPALTRSLAKKPVMVAGYGAGTKSILFGDDCIYQHLKANGYKNLARELLDEEGTQQIFIDILTEVIEPVLELIELVKTAVQTDKYRPITWLTMDRFPVRLAPDILYNECYDIVTVGNRELRLRNKAVPKNINKKLSQQKVSSSLAVNLIHSLDATHVRLTAEEAMNQNISFIHTHDEYGTHACDYFKLNTIIRRKFVTLHNRDVFASLNNREQNKLNIQIKQGDYQIGEALKATYMFS